MGCGAQAVLAAVARRLADYEDSGVQRGISSGTTVRAPRNLVGMLLRPPLAQAEMNLLPRNEANALTSYLNLGLPSITSKSESRFMGHVSLAIGSSVPSATPLGAMYNV